MGKNIVFCADGTWKGPGEEQANARDASAQDENATNVLKLYHCLAGDDVLDLAIYRRANEQERRFASPDSGETLQVAKYLHGVGDSDNALIRLIGGVFGAGLMTRIIRGYTFISRNHEPGDRIYIVGFSRGAYTARALAGLIASRGVIDAQAHDLSDKEEAYRLGAAVWANYRKQVCLAHDASALQRFDILLNDLPRFFSRGEDEVVCEEARVRAVGVWDTVGSLGIPQYNAESGRLDDFRFANTKLHGKVEQGFHAIAIDEQRGDFTPTLWDADPRVTQLLFPGAHADVGGGYPPVNGGSGLSDGALHWMMAQLATAGLLFTPSPPITIAPDALAPAHAPWKRVPWRLFNNARERAGIERLPHHPSVKQRWAQRVVCDMDEALYAHYQPTNIVPPV